MNAQKEIAGRFVIGSEIAQRTTCTVYLGQDKTLGDREVAIKVFNDPAQDKQEWITSFEEELKKLRSASHPALVPILAGGCEDNTFYIAMEYIPGKLLRDILKEQNGPLDIERALEIATELANGLQEIHEQQLYHGHVDSRCVLFKSDEVRLAGYQPRVIDQIQKQATSVARVVADVAYISPEQLGGSESIDGRADIYAVSALLYEMVTGVRPFVAANPIQAAMLRLTEAPPSPGKKNSNLSPLLDATILKGLAKDPKDRFQDCKQFVDAINGARKIVKNPFAESAPAQSERIGTETIAVSMSTDAIRDMLKGSAAQKADPPTMSGVQLDVAGTMMGMKAQGASKASFVGLDESLRGKSYVLDKPQSMIGNDPGCDICISGRDVPARYAIVIQRAEKFFIAPLSPTPVKVSDMTTKGAEEIPLERGAVLHVGKHQLRFVAPGEVFTLKDNVADRVIDRPKSRLPALLLGVTAIIGIFALGGIYLYKERVASQKAALAKREAVKQQQRSELVRKLLREGDEFFKAGALTEPVGANAEEKFRSVVQLEPDNSYAKRRLAEIDERAKLLDRERQQKVQFAQRIKELVSDGDRYFQEKQYVSPPGKNARDSYEEVLRIDSSNADAKKRLQEITTIMGDLLGKVNSMIASAKQYAAEGKYVSPPDANAYDQLKQVQQIDPSNDDAKKLIYDMAASSLYRGDVAKERGIARDIRESYLTAQALGVDPACIAVKMKGVELIEISKGRVLMTTDTQCPKSGAGYLDSGELDRRVGNLALQAKLAGGGKSKPEKVVYEVNKK